MRTSPLEAGSAPNTQPILTAGAKPRGLLALNSGTEDLSPAWPRGHTVAIHPTPKWAASLASCFRKPGLVRIGCLLAVITTSAAWCRGIAERAIK